MAPEDIVSAISGEPIDPTAGYVTDADGNHYALDEYSIAVDKAAEGEPAGETKS